MMTHPIEMLPTGTTLARAWRWSGFSGSSRDEVLAEEMPVALVFNGISHAVMMATPKDLEDFALGFGLTEGLLDSPAELYGIDEVATHHGIELRLEVAAACAWRLKELRRSMAGRTGCGLCGTDSLTQVRRSLPPVADICVSVEAIARAESALRDWQLLQQFTGATHAAAWVSLNGAILRAREDVGRHNALDKLVGALVRERIDIRQGFVLVTSRASFEMVQKTVALGAGLLAAVSAPTALAVVCAQAANLCVTGFVRAGGLTAYTFPNRLKSDTEERVHHEH